MGLKHLTDSLTRKVRRQDRNFYEQKIKPTKTRTRLAGPSATSGSISEFKDLTKLFVDFSLPVEWGDCLGDGCAVDSGMPRPADAVSSRILSVRALAYLSGDFRRTHPQLSHLRRLRLLPVLLSFVLSRSLPPAVHFYLRPNSFFFSRFDRRFVGALFGSKGTNAILSVEYFCCDRPNPILQVRKNFVHSMAITLE